MSPFTPSKTLRRWVWIASFVLLAVAAGEGLHRWGLAQALDQRLQDHWFQWRGRAHPVDGVRIVAIDEATLAAYPDEPMVFWSARLAELARRLRLAGASVVGFDLLLSISPERWFEHVGGALADRAVDFDRALREEIHTGRLILVSAGLGRAHDAADFLLPSPDYLLALPDFDVTSHVALADLVDDSDGVVRRFRPAPHARAGDAPSADVPQLSLPMLLALRAGGADPHAADWTLAGVRRERSDPAEPLAFAGPPGSVPVLSMRQILQGGLSPEQLHAAVANRVVLVGVGAGFGDDHYTPYTSSLSLTRGALMSGVEIHAQAVQALLDGRRIVPASSGQRLALSALLAALLAAVAARADAWRALGALALSWAGLFAGGYAAFASGWALPVTSVALAAALAMAAVITWRLTGEERERSRVRQLFGRYVSEQVVQQLLASDDRPALGGQTQHLTVLFSDIRGFTTLSEQLQAHEVVELLNTYFERACAVLLAHGGSIDKFIGDAIMVEFGSPLPTEDHARRAIQAALALQAVAHDFAHWVATRFAERGLAAFGIGIGLHTGSAVIGNVGSATRMEFTAIGDTVNLASRLEGATRTLGCDILASAAVVQAAGAGVQVGRSQPLQVKGRAESVLVYEILGITS